MYIRGEVQEALMGKELAASMLDEADRVFLQQTIDEFVGYFGADVSEIKIDDFKKYTPKSSRPYGNMYIGN